MEEFSSSSVEGGSQERTGLGGAKTGIPLGTALVACLSRRGPCLSRSPEDYLYRAHGLSSRLEPDREMHPLETWPRA